MSDDLNNSGGHGSQGEGRGHSGEHRAMNPLRTLVALVATLLLVVVAIAGVEIGRSKSATGATISVNGTGTIQGTPDTATFDIGVHTTNSSAKAALEANNQKVKALVAALLRNGVKKKEMQTSGLNVYQNTNNSGVVTGFSVDDTLNVTMHDVQQSGAAIDSAATAVGNGIQLNGITFSISNQSKLLAIARAKAMHNARIAADQLALAGGTHVTAIVRISDTESQIQPIFYNGALSASADFKAAIPVQTGQQPISVQVSVVFALAG